MKKFLVLTLGAVVGAFTAAVIYRAASKPDTKRSMHFNRGHRRIAKKKLVMRKKARFNHAEHPTHGVERTPARERAAA